MPFKEHRGSGKGGRRRPGMPALWDAEWATTKVDPESCRESQSWPVLNPLLEGRNEVLEAGSGQGQWVKFLSDRGWSVSGIDYSSVGIQQARETWPEIQDRFVLGDLRYMPFESESFDAVVSFGAIEHNEDGIRRPLEEMLRVLRPGGVLYCSVPCLNVLRAHGLIHVQDFLVRNRTVRRLAGRSPGYDFFEYVYSRDEYERELIESGFVLKEVVPLGAMEIPFLGRSIVAGRASERLFRRFPWANTHMMAAICERPLRGRLPSNERTSL